jgi:phosphotriesterase-related protein
MMAYVNTVSGPIDTGDLGVTYMHEHIFVVSPELQFYWPGFQGWDEDKYVAEGRETLKRLHDEYGVDTIMDPTVPGLGRNIRAVARAVEGTGLNVVACTGWYAYNELPWTFFMKDMAGKAAELERLFVHDFENGLDGTTIKPGAIKCSTDIAGLTPDVEALLRAAARAHLRTGLPIITHTNYANESGLLQQRIFIEEGVDMGAVLIGHCNESDDLDYLERLLGNGTYVGFDRCGLESPVAPLEKQLDNLAELCRRGYSKQLVLSHDNFVFMDLLPPGDMDWSNWAIPRYGHIHNQTLPGLRERGITPEQLDDMLIEAPRAYFSRAKAGT